MEDARGADAAVGYSQRLDQDGEHCRGKTTIILPDINVVRKNCSYFICQEVFSQQGTFECCTSGSEMLQHETDSKTRRYFGSDIQETQVGVLMFGNNCQL